MTLRCAIRESCVDYEYKLFAVLGEAEALSGVQLLPTEEMRKLSEMYDTYEREVRDLPCFEFRTTVTT